MTVRSDPERIWLEPQVEGVRHEREWAESDVWAEMGWVLTPTEYVRADLVRALVGQLTRVATIAAGAGRVLTLIHAVQAIDGFEMTQDEAAAVLAAIDAADRDAP